MPVAEDGLSALEPAPARSACRPTAAGRGTPQRFVQPIGNRRVLMAVAKEGHVAQLGSRPARAGGCPANGSRQLGKLDHWPPQLDSR